jgi:hypothetical protein
MNTFLRDWLHNLWVTVLVVIGVGLFMLIFMRIFYPEALSALFLMGQFSVQFATALKLWPIIILGIIVSAFPQRRRRRR